MKHKSVPISPIEIINMEDSTLSPLISKVQIKVCYVGDEPNRNRSIITKEVAKGMAPSLRGCPIVGYYNEYSEDFEEHNRSIEISNGEVKLKDTTRPYGFVDLNADVWFQTFLDDDEIEREYLVTEGYIWTGQYPETKRIMSVGNNQSMELDETFLNATWTKDNNGKPQFFIINEAIVSKLCILGENNEPCFEGAQVAKFSFDDGFEDKLFSMMDELKKLIKEGGAEEVYTTYAVEIGDVLWNSLWNHLEKQYPDTEGYCSIYRIEGVFEEAGQKFVILQNRNDLKYYRMDFTYTEEAGLVPSDALVEVTKSYTPAEQPQFALEAVEEFETQYKAALEEKKDEPLVIEPTYNLEEVVEYAELLEKYNALVSEMDTLRADYTALETENNSLKEEIEPLKEFKLSAEKKEKQEMIDQFYMLSDEDKADVIENIDTYSLSDIEAKLSIICVRNKVSFDLDENNTVNKPTIYTFNDVDAIDTPAWVRSVQETAKSM